MAKYETVTGEFQEANGPGSLASATVNHKEMPVSNKWKAELLEARLRDLLVGEKMQDLAVKRYFPTPSLNSKP